MTINSRAKGASSEREFCKLVYEWSGVRLIRNLEQSRSGGFDLIVHDDEVGQVADSFKTLAIECKRYSRVTPGLIKTWWTQARRQAEPNGLTPVFEIQYGGVEHEHGETYSIPKSVIQTGGTGSLVVTVDEVGLQTGRPWTREAGSFVFVADWLMITYEFTDGQDLDTRTQITSPAIASFNPATATADGANNWTTSSVGYAQGNTQGSPTIMTWGGDNVGTGFESVLINMTAFQTAYPGQTMTIDCRAYWFGQPGVNPVTLAAVLWKGGTPTPTSYKWSNAGATGTLSLNQILVPVTTAGFAVETGQHVGTVTYSPTSGSGSVALQINA